MHPKKKIAIFLKEDELYEAKFTISIGIAYVLVILMVMVISFLARGSTRLRKVDSARCWICRVRM